MLIFKLKYSYYIFLIFIIAVCMTAFLFFRNIHEVEKGNIKSITISKIRDEVSSANSYAIAKSIADLEKVNLFSCVTVIEKENYNRAFYTTTQKNECNTFFNNFFFKNRN